MPWFQLVLAALILSIAAPAAGQDWASFISKDEGFSAVYPGAEKMHNDTVAACQAAKGAGFKDGDACQNDFRVEVAGAMDFAAWNFMKRDGVKLTHYMWYFNEMVAGRLLQTSARGVMENGVKREDVRTGDSIKVRCHSLRDGSAGCLLGFVTPNHGDQARGHGIEKEWD